LKHEPAVRAAVGLPCGRTLEFEIRRSRVRNVYFRMCPPAGLRVTAPRRMSHRAVLEAVGRKSRWISSWLSEFEAVGHVDGQVAARPESFELAALAETWRVEYKSKVGSGKSEVPNAVARTVEPGRIVVSGAIDDVGACRQALRRWLARHAAGALAPWLARLAEQAGLRYAGLSVRSQRARWGSCSAAGRISLNCKLLFLPRESVSYVMVHELCHLLEANHSHRFWAHVRRLEPASDALRRQMRHAWRLVPAWSERDEG
jgi:predicted metal-dependent hydrolase